MLLMIIAVQHLLKAFIARHGQLEMTGKTLCKFKAAIMGILIICIQNTAKKRSELHQEMRRLRMVIY